MFYSANIAWTDKMFNITTKICNKLSSKALLLGYVLTGLVVCVNGGCGPNKNPINLKATYWNYNIEDPFVYLYFHDTNTNREVNGAKVVANPPVKEAEIFLGKPPSPPGPACLCMMVALKPKPYKGIVSIIHNGRVIEKYEIDIVNEGDGFTIEVDGRNMPKL